MTAVIVLLDGSRNLWLAIAVASAVMIAIRTRQWLRKRLTPRRLGLIGVALGGSVFIAVTAGIATPLVARLANSETVLARGDLWTASVDAWLTRPLFGWGAGSYPFLLQQTDYFQGERLGAASPR